MLYKRAYYRYTLAALADCHVAREGSMFRCLAGFVLCFLLALMGASTVAAADCQFVLGFNTLRDLIGHDIVGECLENRAL